MTKSVPAAQGASEEPKIITPVPPRYKEMLDVAYRSGQLSEPAVQGKEPVFINQGKAVDGEIVMMCIEHGFTDCEVCNEESVEGKEEPSAPRPIHVHKTRPIQVWVDVDEGIAHAVAFLNTIPGVRTFGSCQGTIGEGGAEPYGSQVMIYAEGEALEEVKKSFTVGETGDGWMYVHPLAQPSVQTQETK